MTLPSRQFLIQQAVLCAINVDLYHIIVGPNKAVVAFDTLIDYPHGAFHDLMTMSVTTHFHRLLAEAQAREISEPRAML